MVGENRLTNDLYIVQGEISCIVTEMKRSMRYSAHTIVSSRGLLLRLALCLRQSVGKCSVIKKPKHILYEYNLCYMNI